MNSLQTFLMVCLYWKINWACSSKIWCSFINYDCQCISVLLYYHTYKNKNLEDIGKINVSRTTTISFQQQNESSCQFSVLLIPLLKTLLLYILAPQNSKEAFKDCCLRWERWMSTGPPTLTSSTQSARISDTLGVFAHDFNRKIILHQKKSKKKKIIIGLKATSPEHFLLVWVSGRPFMQVAHDITRPQLFLINSASQRKIQPFYNLTFFKATAHSANQPNTLNAVKTAVFHKYKFDKKTLRLHRLHWNMDWYEVLKDTRLGSKASLFYHPEGNACQANRTSSGSKLKNPEAYNPHWGLDTISNMSWLCKCVLCLLIMPN